MDGKTRKYAPSPRRYVWVLCLLTILCLVILAACEGTPEPGTSPITTQADDDEMLGYFMFETYGLSSMVGTITVSQTLRTIDDEVLASRSYEFPVDIANTTDTIGSPLGIARDWPVTSFAPTREWSTAHLHASRPDGEAVLVGRWFTDLNTPAEPGPDGAYMTRRFDAWCVYFPLLFLE